MGRRTEQTFALCGAVEVGLVGMREGGGPRERRGERRLAGGADGLFRGMQLSDNFYV